MRAHLDRDLILLDLTLEAGIPGDVLRSLIDGKLIVSVSRHDGELVDRVNANNEEDLDGLAADFARQMKEVTLAALDRITKEMERLSESVQKVNECQAHFESVMKFGPRLTDEPRIDIECGWRRRSAISFCACQRSKCSQGSKRYTGNTLWVVF